MLTRQPYVGGGGAFLVLATGEFELQAENSNEKLVAHIENLHTRIFIFTAHNKPKQQQKHNSKINAHKNEVHIPTHAQFKQKKKVRNHHYILRLAVLLLLTWAQLHGRS